MPVTRHIVSARVENHTLALELSDGTRGWFPLGHAPRLDLAREGQLNRFEVSVDGGSIYWPELDDHLSLTEIEHWILPIPEDIDPPHACDQVLTILVEGVVPLAYDDRYREYSLPVVGESAVQIISHCPFCGERLPASLRPHWFSELERLGLEPEGELPDAMRDGRWWRERGL